jgi:N-carbamoyl-L-amino-acid hydrolase
VGFGPPLAGSSVFAGVVDVASVHAARTLDGTTVRQDLEATGYFGLERPGARKFDCFVEAHIEQGPILEAERKTIGVVTRVQGLRWLKVTVTGMDGHAGTTPMDRRRDALQGAAEMVLAINGIAREADRWARLTNGRFDIEPNSGATIPGRVGFICDLRHPASDALAALDAKMQAAMRAIAERRGLGIEIERVMEKPPVQFDGAIVDAIREAAQSLGYASLDMLSGAGHDAMNVARVAPTGMIFVPCKDGLSHNEAESAEPSHLAAGANTLLRTLLARALRAWT